MMSFSDRLLLAVSEKGAPCVVGLDPRIDAMPNFVINLAKSRPSREAAIRDAITTFHRFVIDSVHDLVPAIKPQSAFYEQYGIPGLMALQDTIEYARNRNLIVILDAKRNDIGSTAEAYANAFLGRSSFFGGECAAFEADALTVTPYLGSDSLLPFINACERYAKGIFVLVKTSNPGSKDIQDLEIGTSHGRMPLYQSVGELVHRLGQHLIGSRGYSSVGAVVGATFPHEAEQLRRLMPSSVFLVPGYGTQGGSAADAARCFDRDGFGAVVNSSRGITYELPEKNISESEFRLLLRKRVQQMIADINAGIVHRPPSADHGASPRT